MENHINTWEADLAMFIAAAGGTMPMGNAIMMLRRSGQHDAAAALWLRASKHEDVHWAVDTELAADTQPGWIGLLSSWIQGRGCMELKHLQRSVPIRLTSSKARPKTRATPKPVSTPRAKGTGVEFGDDHKAS